MLILERPWTRQPQGAHQLSSFANSLGLRMLWNAGAGGILAPASVSNSVFIPDTTARVVPFVDYISAPILTASDYFYLNSESWQQGNAFTLFSLLRLPSVSGTQTVVSKFQTGANSWVLRIVSGAIDFVVYTNNWYSCAASAAVTANRWSFVSATFANGQIVAYLNGVPGTPVSVGGTASSAASMRVGVSTENKSSPLNGYLPLFGIAGAWSAQQHKQVADNPWQLFAPQQIIIPTAVAASSLPTLSASTYVPGSVTATGWRPQITAS